MSLNIAMKTELYSGSQEEVVSKVLNIVIQLAQAISCAHNHGVLLQTIAPSTVEITETNQVRLRPDLVHLRRREKPLDEKGTWVLETPYSGGTPPTYRSPEIAMEVESVTPATCDLWAWGLIVLELFGGQVWTVGEGESAKEALENFQARPLIDENWTPEEVVQWLEQCMGTSNATVMNRILSQLITGEKILSIRSPRDIIMKMGLTDQKLCSDIWDTINCKSRRYQMPEEIVNILERCFRFDSGQRFPSMLDILEELRPLVDKLVPGNISQCNCSATAANEPEDKDLRMKWASLLNNIGVCCWQRELVAEAEQFYKLSLKYDERNCEGNFNLGRLSEAYNDLGHAFEYFEVVLELMGDTHPYYQTLLKEQKEVKRRKCLMGTYKNASKGEAAIKLSQSQHRRISFHNARSKDFVEFMRR